MTIDKVVRADVCIWKPMMLNQESRYKCEGCLWEEYHCDLYDPGNKGEQLDLFKQQLKGVDYH